MTLRFCSPLLLGASLLAASFLGPAPDVTAQDKFQTVLLTRQKFPSPRVSLRMGSFAAPGINSRGAIVFYGTVYGSGINTDNNGFLGWVGPNGRGARVLAQKGSDFIVSGEQTTLTALSTNPHINSNFISAWSGVFDNGNTYLFSASRRGALRIFSFYPGASVIDPEWDFNDRGAISLLAGDLDQRAVPISVFRESLSSRVPLVSVGETAIGAPLGATFTGFGFPTLANDGNVFFTALVSETDNQFDGVWFGRNTDPSPLVTIGQAVVGTSSFSEETVAAIEDPVVPSPSGNFVAMAASTSNGSENGILRVSVASRQITVVARSGQSVRGSREALSNIQPAAVSDSGRVAFGIKGTAFSQSSPDITRVSAIFTGTKSTNIRKVVEVGDNVLVRGVRRTVIDLRFAPTRGLNNAGQIAFTASFSDRSSGIFIAKVGDR